MKVYIIMSGCIDDVYPYGVFSSEEKAQEEINSNPQRYLEPYIEERELDIAGFDKNDIFLF